MKKYFLDSFYLINIEGGSGIDAILKDNQEIAFTCGGNSIELKEAFEPFCHYQLISEGNYYKLNYRFIYQDPDFDMIFPFIIEKLIPHYYKEHTTFGIYAPLWQEANIKLNGHIYNYTYRDESSFYFDIKGDFENCFYRFILKRDDEYIEVCDPFAYGSLLNGGASIVLDENKFFKNFIKTKEIKKEETIIYELSLRDFSSDKNVYFKYHKTFKALQESGLKIDGKPYGIDYIIALGITHIQLMPILDFGSIDETSADYNWGYDPSQFNVLEGSYINDYKDPYARINEASEAFSYLHSCGLKINLDVVFNHVYKVADFDLHKILPYYCFRYLENGELANGSYCGNEIRSEAPFMRAYICAMCMRLIDLYDIDGLRFDLMSLIDIDTLNLIALKAFKKKKDFILYGEGWQLPTPLNNGGSIKMADKLKNYAFFNGHYRDVLRGSPFNNGPAFLSGNYKDNQEVLEVLRADCFDGLFSSPLQSISFLECHDNRTLYDQLCLLIKEDDINREKRILMGFAILLLCPGIPFIQAGQEFLRTKKGYENTYNLGDEINSIDWFLCFKKSSFIEQIKELIALRKEIKSIHFKNKDKIEKYMHFIQYYECLIVILNEYKIYLNPSEYTLTIPIEKEVIIFQNKRCNTEIEKELIIGPLEFILTKNS